MHRVGHWSRQVGCAFSASCTQCRATDTRQAALHRQEDAAGSRAEQPRRIVPNINGDMKGLMQILGLAGPAGVYNCMFCLAHKNQTNVKGIPCLRHPPEGPWTAAHLARPVEVRDPPARGGTDEIAERAAAFQRDAAAPGAKKDLSSGQPKYQSCVAEPFFWSDDLIEHVSKMPLHILLGIGTNRLNRIEAELLKLDEEWALNSGVGERVAAWNEANAAVFVQQEVIDAIQESITSHEVAMLECLDHDPQAGSRGNPKAGDAGEWKRRYLEEKKDKLAFEKSIKEEKKKLEKLEATETETKKAALEAASTGPFAQTFAQLLKDIGISRQKYFGGTFVGPDLHTIFGHRTTISRLCALLKARSVETQSGEVKVMGSDARAAEVEAVLQDFGELHRLFSRKDALCEHEIVLFGQLVERFMCGIAHVYPDEQPTPKMHVLGWHYVEMLERHGSIGIDSEQGIEALHPEFNYVLSHFKSMERNRPAQLEATVGRVWGRGGGAAVRHVEGMRSGKQEKEERARERSKRKERD